MAAFAFLVAQAAASKAEGQQASIPIYSLLMQINADAVCLVRTQFQQFTSHTPRSMRTLFSWPLSVSAPRGSPTA